MSTRDIGDRLLRAREHANLTHRSLSALADVATATISMLETRAESAPSTETVARLAKALGVEPCWLAYGDAEKEPDWLGEVIEPAKLRRGRKSRSGRL